MLLMFFFLLYFDYWSGSTASTQPASFIIETTATTEPGLPPGFPWDFDDNEEPLNDKSYQKE